MQFESLLSSMLSCLWVDVEYWAYYWIWMGTELSAELNAEHGINAELNVKQNTNETLIMRYVLSSIQMLGGVK